MNRKIAGLTRYKQAILDKVVELVAGEFSIYTEDLFRKSKANCYSTPRGVAVGLLRTKYGFGHQLLSDYFGYKSHTSTIYAAKKIDAQLKSDPELQSIVVNIINNISKEVTLENPKP